jgi:hypothetical protein
MTFVKGQSGNPAGRPPGSKHKISEKFISALTADFEQHGETVISQVRSEKPEQYLSQFQKDTKLPLNKEQKAALRQYLTGEQA